MKYQIKVLKETSISINDKVVKFPYKKAMVLFIYIAINKEVSRNEISHLLWENTTNVELRKNLRNALYTIRKLLGKDVIITTDNKTVYLNLEYEYNIDFYDLLNNTDYKCIISEYSLFMSDISFDGLIFLEKWIKVNNEKLLQKYIHACDRLININIELNNDSKVIDYLKKKVLYYDYDEKSYRLLMSIYAKHKDYDKAIEYYHLLSSKLSLDLGVKCENETTSLYESIVNDSLYEKRLSRINLLVPLQKDFLNILKDSYYKLLYQSLNSNILISGESGYGKSYIIEQFLYYITNNNNTLIKIDCFKQDSDYIFKSIAPLIDELSYNFDTINFNKLLTYAVKEANFVYQKYSQYQSFEKAVLSLFAKILENNKIVIVIENIHYMDEDSFRLLDMIINQNYRNLLLIVSSRDNDILNMSDTMIRKLVLTPWSLEDVSQVVKKKDQEKYDLERIYEDSGGKPYVIINRIKTNIQVNEDNMYYNMIKDCNVNQIKILNILSLFERNASFSALQSILTISSTDLIEELRSLEENQLLISTKTSKGIFYQFAYQSLKEYVADRIEEYVRKQLHNIIAVNIEANQVNVVSTLYLYQTLVNHFKAADNHLKELEYIIKYHSIKNYCQCEIFSIIDISLIDSLFANEAHDFNEVLSDIEEKIKLNVQDSMFLEEYHEIIILFYVMKTRFYLKHKMNEIAYESIVKLQEYCNERSIKEKQTISYLFIYYCLNTNDVQLLKKILCELEESINLLDNFSIEYTKSAITLYRFKGYYYMHTNSNKSALQCYEKALNIYNNSLFYVNQTYPASVYHYLSQLYLIENKIELAVKALNRCLALLVKDNLLLDAILITKGYLTVAHYLNNDIKKAREYAVEFNKEVGVQSFKWKEELFEHIMGVIINNNIKDNNFDIPFDRLIYGKVIEKNSSILML